jgi:hypothetical protein
MQRTRRITLGAFAVLVCNVASLTPAFGQHLPVAGMRSGFVTTRDGVRIHYLEAGPRTPAGKTVPILFVPGWTMPAEIWGGNWRISARPATSWPWIRGRKDCLRRRAREITRKPVPATSGPSWTN